MSKHIYRFETESEYDSVKSTLPEPYLAMCEDSDRVFSNDSELCHPKRTYGKIVTTFDEQTQEYVVTVSNLSERAQRLAHDGRLYVLLQYEDCTHAAKRVSTYKLRTTWYHNNYEESRPLNEQIKYIKNYLGRIHNCKFRSSGMDYYDRAIWFQFDERGSGQYRIPRSRILADNPLLGEEIEEDCYYEYQTAYSKLVRLVNNTNRNRPRIDTHNRSVKMRFYLVSDLELNSYNGKLGHSRRYLKTDTNVFTFQCE